MEPTIDLDPTRTLEILAQLNPSNLKINDQSESESEDESEDEYVYIIQDPKTGENIEIAVGDLPEEVRNKKLYYDPYKRILFYQNEEETDQTSITNQKLNEKEDVCPLMDGLCNNLKSYQQERGSQLTGDEELILINAEIVERINKYNVQAHIYRILNYIVNIGSILITSALGFMIATEHGNRTLLAIMAFSVAIIRAGYELLKLGTLGIVYKELATKLNELFRDIEDARKTMISDEEKKKYARFVLGKLSEIDLETFNMSYGPKSLQEIYYEDTYLLDNTMEDDTFLNDINSYPIDQTVPSAPLPLEISGMTCGNPLQGFPGLSRDREIPEGVSSSPLEERVPSLASATDASEEGSSSKPHFSDLEKQ